MKQQRRPAWLSLLLAAIAIVATTGAAHAQPNVTKMVVPFPPGGVTDQVARIMAEHMGRQLGQVIIIDNRPGAGSRLGVEAVIKSPGDGTTLLFTNSSYSILPVVDPKISFDPAKALAPVSMTATYGLQIVAKKDIRASTLAEFIAYAKKNPGKLSYGSAGMGSGAHFAGEYFKSLTGTFLVHIPYRSTAGALNDVAGGQLDMAFDASAKPLVDAGHVKLLAVTSRQRDPRFPGTQTATEAGVKSFVLESWVGLLAPATTPQPVLEKLSKAAAAAVADPAVQKRFAELGLRPEGGSSARFADAIRDDLALYRGIAKESKLQFE
ncbi:tripartite tricarboxylate transporter substrate-binding protein [Variovorax paradoxus]|uniref:Bug family tripartite tricarboxylate transporter substrate binding protein n=1 Tax=Variovorax paradoxus TaxID=34073 RepID=UPI0003741422|nr:tripartite tricarboxylate transporter substrate-binding protein [Variovorax paradoxus]